ncbi:MAG: DUF1572 family protein [Phycisphaeraceae bacterium]|nr:DUF1572 family protein [Phycisphaeraceae bacterium]
MHDAATIIRSWRDTFLAQKRLAEGAMAQVSDEQLHSPLAAGLNSIAVIVQHLAGNFESRFGSGWLEVDGERPTRDRDTEFADRRLPRDQLMALWDRGWQTLLSAVDALRPEDLSRTIHIRNELHTLPLAMARALAHAAYHTGQIMQIARGLAGSEGWRWQTVRPGGTREFNRTKGLPY